VGHLVSTAFAATLLVAGTYNRLKLQDFFSVYAKPSNLPPKQSAWGDRRRLMPKGLRILQLLLQPHLDQRLIRHISRVGS
jgi:hypothetical protein